MNPTMAKFGYPDSLVREYPRWVVLLRPAQATLGSLVLVCKEPVTRFGALSTDAFVELGRVVSAVEAALGGAFAYDRINYLMLMMIDPDVHCPVVPRYAAPRTFAGTEFKDAGWPGVPRLDAVNDTPAAARTELLHWIRSHWPADPE
jgi:diadenosine tetraphosphate (Ap4A) HIT family hydrolase